MVSLAMQDKYPPSLENGLAGGNVHSGVSAHLVEIAQGAVNGLSGSHIGIVGDRHKGVLFKSGPHYPLRS